MRIAIRKTQILILDDEPIVCKRLRPAFQKAGFEVETFTDSASAMARIEEKKFDIVITDLKMKGVERNAFPGANQRDCARYRRCSHNGVCHLGQRQGVIPERAFDFVAKPFKLSNILDTVRRLVENRRAG